MQGCNHNYYLYLDKGVKMSLSSKKYIYEFSYNYIFFNECLNNKYNKYCVLMNRLVILFDQYETLVFVDNKELKKSLTLYSALLNSIILNVCIIFDMNTKNSLYDIWQNNLHKRFKSNSESIKLRVTLLQILIILKKYYNLDVDCSFKKYNKRVSNDEKYIDKTLINCFKLRNKFICHNMKLEADVCTLYDVFKSNDIDVSEICMDLKAIFLKLLYLYCYDNKIDYKVLDKHYLNLKVENYPVINQNIVG